MVERLHQLPNVLVDVIPPPTTHLTQVQYQKRGADDFDHQLEYVHGHRVVVSSRLDLGALDQRLGKLRGRGQILDARILLLDGFPRSRHRHRFRHLDRFATSYLWITHGDHGSEHLVHVHKNQSLLIPLDLQSNYGRPLLVGYDAALGCNYHVLCGSQTPTPTQVVLQGANGMVLGRNIATHLIGAV